ncbi:hypothetical protein ACRS2S_05700 [Achromobacter xylosoxidans]|uniref:hypothetical protein n=1 Tax=Alcaligenes xylosoxydans xylosoxydans TaxID=85698 RepID=UPI001562B53B|nr:hypothetical protein [Achromobacter xylosoxidans]MBK1977271.1 hypothetical protein [Achromobacter xylosoxidans]MEC6408687.1 hypothetical protein [Achromobacter xylosoxidans]QKI68152.1 hypothetical protein HPS44_13770 [Achromobacter xylosoxidans]
MASRSNWALRSPTNGQDALNTSVQVKQTSTRRIGIDYKTREFVVFDETKKSVYHGHVRSWKKLHPDMQNALTRAGMVNRKGKILIDGEKMKYVPQGLFYARPQKMSSHRLTSMSFVRHWFQSHLARLTGDGLKTHVSRFSAMKIQPSGG